METVTRILPMYWIRAAGGLLVFISFLIMIYNLWKTIKGAPKDQKEEVYMAPAPLWRKSSNDNEKGHRKLEGLIGLFAVLSFVAVLVGTVIEFLPAFYSNQFVEISPKVKPYTPLEIAGRDIYIKEGCYTCHSQMIRPMVDEGLRYGKISEATEFIYDRPFQWGSKRTGPDLHRVGGKYPDSWHYRHMLDPREVTPDSIMPSYPWLFKKNTSYQILTRKLKVMQALGVPYAQEEVDNAADLAREQAQRIITSLEADGIDPKMKDKEIIALIAYLQRLGTDLGGKDEVTSAQ